MAKSEGTILIIDDDPGVRQTAKFILKQEYTNVLAEEDPRKIPFLLTNHPVDVLLLDMNFKPGSTGGEEGLSWLQQIKGEYPGTKTIMITAYGELDLAVEAMKAGAIDFIVKPWENEKFLATVRSVFQLSQSHREIAGLREVNQKLNTSSGHVPMIVGDSPSFKAVLDLIEKVAPTDADVLITGENGTGKDLIAKLIHHRSHRLDSPFIKVDVGSLPETLFESEMFGHVKGAFTDAYEDRIGWIEVAAGGTLFLDEIGNLSLPSQSKLLTAIQNREISRVGSSQKISTDIRLITASNANISEMVREGSFREDLFYRLNTFQLHVPPLRERKSDIETLANHFLRRFERKYKREKVTFDKSALRKLGTYSWPGNIRELEHIVERAVILTDKTRITPSEILLGDNHQPAESPTTLNLDELEKATIQKALVEFDGNMSLVAKALGLGRTTLYRKLKKYGL